MTRTARLLVLLSAVVLLGAVGTGAVLYGADRADRKDQEQVGGPPVRPGEIGLGGGRGQLLFRNLAWGPHRDEVVSVPAGEPGGVRTSSGLKCLRFHAAAGTGVCLEAVHGALDDTYRAVVLDERLRERRTLPAAGIPSRARVSPSGRFAAWTVFVSGDSYAGSNFSTRTSIVDTRDWHFESSLEDFTVLRDGRPLRASDINVWGVTFADDDRTFYATVATGGQTYLARGDLAARTLSTLHQNVECPSLSPDGTRVAYKKRVPGASPDAPWRLYVLDLATMTETATTEQRNIDDQALWSDGSTLVYSLPGEYGADLWTVPADGSGAPATLAVSAVAPAYLR
ncbi:TolB family protein [Kitasatospora sp. NPDC096147]|uniref:TolB family protein n=1 Tax=Kitasatospora sp. NPDC096147 TaxID=3364093 RepID=UPI00380C4505